MKKSKILYSINSEHNQINAHSEGVIDFQDFDLHMKELTQDDSFYSGINGLYDFTQVEKIIGDASFFEKTSDRITDKTLIKDRAKVAIVIGDNKLLEGIFSGWKVMMSFTLISYETFRTIGEAEAWLAA